MTYLEQNDQYHFFDSVLNDCPDAVLINQLGNPLFIYTNDKASDYLGYNRYDLLKMATFEIDYDNRLELIIINIANIELATPLKYKTRYKSQENKIFPVEVESSFFYNEDKTYIMSLIRKIPKSKEQQIILLAIDDHHEKTIDLSREECFRKTNKEAIGSENLAMTKSMHQLWIEATPLIEEFIRLDLIYNRRELTSTLYTTSEKIQTLNQVVHIICKITNQLKITPGAKQDSIDYIDATTSDSSYDKINKEKALHKLTKKILQEIYCEYPNAIDNNLNQKFQDLYIGTQTPTFLAALKERCPELTAHDIQHCICIRLNLETKEIAQYFNILPKSIQTSRFRLKKKLKLSNSTDLRNYILSI